MTNKVRLVILVREREREKGRCEVVEVFLSFYDWKIVWVLRGGQLEKK